MVHTFSFPNKIYFGPGSRHKLPKLLRDLKIKRPMLVTDTGISKLAFFKDIEESLRLAGFTPGLFDGAGGNPVKSQVRAGVQTYHSHGADAIIAIGGGAPMDVAKVIALMAHHPGDVFDYEDGKEDALPVDGRMPLVIAIPTTAGTGSEVGRSSVISDDETKAKKIIFDPRMLPPIAIADPELTVGLPRPITAATGMDALTHNVEAYLARGFHPMADAIALRGVKMIAKNLERAYLEPTNIEARGNVLLASLMGAVAFQKGLGITHSLAHPLSTVCDLHHGLANAIMIPHAMRFNATAAGDRLRDLAVVAELENPGAETFIAWLCELSEQLDIPSRLSKVGVNAGHIDDLVEFGWNDPCHLSNPRTPEKNDFRVLYEEAL
jgi:alcohol dehydrogenase class IV